jgi:SP family arabinose:H+ symporter-like MFS transporter
MDGGSDIKNLQDSGSLAYVLLVSVVAAVGGLLFGFDTAVIAGANPFLKAHFELSEAMLGFAVASAIIGCIFGAAFAGTTSDRFGRKRVLLLCAVLFAVSAVGSAIPRTLVQFVIARFIGGLGVGAASMLSPMYIAEISPARIRGRLVSLNQLAIVTGILVAYFVDFFAADIPDTNWRWMFGSETLPAVLFFLLLLTVPESPRWLAKQQRQEEALAILTKVGGKDHAEAEMAEIKDAIAQEQDSVAQLFHPGMRVALIIGIALAILQQITGINIVMYYAPTIFASAGATIDASLLHAVAVGAVNLTFTLVAIWVVDKFGRKVLLLAGSAGMGLFLTLVGGVFHYGKLEGMWVLLFILGYIACFASSLGPVVWVLISEIFPTRIRGRAMAIATVSLWVSCAAVAQVFPIMLEKLDGAVTFGIFAAMCLITFVFVLLVVPETKGKTLEQIEKRWMRRPTTAK